MNVLVILGTTLAGKTTHAKLLAQKHKGEYISSGDIARSLMDDKTSEQFKDGQLSPHDDAILHQIKTKILTTENDFVILDGFPRNEHHLKELEGWLNLHFVNCSPCMIYLQVPWEVIVARSGARRRDSFDTLDIMSKRHSVFMSTTLPIWDNLGLKWIKIRLALTKEETVERVQKYFSTFISAYLQGNLTPSAR